MKPPKKCIKTGKYDPEMSSFFSKKGYFCVNVSKFENICHTFLMLNSFI